MTSKLLPCPFCGGKAKYASYRTSEDSEACQVSCGSCDARTNEFEDAYAPSEDAFDAWNRRASTPAPQHKTAGLNDLIEKSKAKLAAMSEEERRAMWQAQRESFVRAMTTPCEHGVLDFEQCPQCRAPAPSEHVMGIDPIGYCVWITPTKLASCAKSAKGAFPVYAAPVGSKK